MMMAGTWGGGNAEASYQDRDAEVARDDVPARCDMKMINAVLWCATTHSMCNTVEALSDADDEHENTHEAAADGGR